MQHMGYRLAVFWQAQSLHNVITEVKYHIMYTQVVYYILLLHISLQMGPLAGCRLHAHEPTGKQIWMRHFCVRSQTIAALQAVCVCPCSDMQ